MEAEPLIDLKNEKLFLIVDQGGHASRAVVMDGLGVPVVSAERPLSTFRPQDGYVEHDPKELIQTIHKSLKEVARKMGDRSESVQAAGLATQRSSIVCWDNQTGEALSPVISWQDTRARDQIIGMSNQTDNVHKRTGLFLSAHYGASKISWCLENIPEVKKAKEGGYLCAGPMSSYLVYQLTDERLFVSDPVSASRTLLWNIHDGNWDADLLHLFKIPEEILPICVPTTHAFGNLEVGGARVPLVLVTGDQSAALFAHGRLNSDTAYINMGTGAFVSRSTGEEHIFQSRLLTSVVHEQDEAGQYVLEGTVNGAGSALEWVRKALAVEALEAQLPGWLKETRKPPLFLNGISGLGAPYWDPDFRSSFFGEGEVQDKVVAVVESIAFLLHTNLLEMDHSLSAPRQIQVSGGLSNLDGLCQMLADLSGITVYRPEETEATARGTCYLLAGQPDHWPEQRPGVSFEHRQAASVIQRYGRWLEEMEKRIMEIRDKG